MSSYRSPGTNPVPRMAITKHFRSWINMPHSELAMTLYTPRFMSSRDIVPFIMPWAADCDGFGGFHEGRYMKMLQRITYLPNCRFVVAPDHFEGKTTDAKRTMEMFDKWLPTLEVVWDDVNERTHQPIAMVAQMGIEDMEVPWDRLQALFIGGDDEFKYSETVRDLVWEAHARGLWVHMGRVNTMERITHCRRIGVDSFDGTGVAKYTNAMWPRLIRAMLAHDNEQMIDFVPRAEGETRPVLEQVPQPVLTRGGQFMMDVDF